MDINNISQTPAKPNRCGQNNPMFGRSHSQESKNKMSQAAQERYRRWKEVEAPRGMTMQEFLTNTPQLDLKGYIQSLVKEDVLKKIIHEEIEKLLQ